MRTYHGFQRFVDHGAPRLHPGPNENLEATQPDRISMYGMAENQAKCDRKKRPQRKT
jgi:hypothetical protein